MQLQDIIKILEDEQLECNIMTSPIEGDDDKLFVFLGNDRSGNLLTLEIILQEQLMIAPSKDKTSSDYHRIQFSLPIPVEVRDFAVSDTARLLTFINKNIDLPGFEYDEIDGKISYRYVLLGHELDPRGLCILGIIGNIITFTEIFDETIATIASGKATFNEMLEQAVTALETVEQ